MQKTQKTYPIEKAAEKLLNEFRLGIKKFFNFFFTIPKRKDDKMIYVMETLAWIFLTIIMVMRLRG